jgi:hypothetical protein
LSLWRYLTVIIFNNLREKFVTWRNNGILPPINEFAQPDQSKTMEFMRRAKMENCRHSSGSSPRVVHVQSYLHCSQSVWQPLAHAPGRGPGMTAAPETPPIAGGTATRKGGIHISALCVGSAANTRPARGIRPARTCDAFLASGARADRGHGPESRSRTRNDLPLSEPALLPLAVALPRMLEKIKAELANKKLKAAEAERLRQRAELIRSLLTPNPVT